MFKLAYCWICGICISRVYGIFDCLLYSRFVRKIEKYLKLVVIVQSVFLM